MQNNNIDWGNNETNSYHECQKGQVGGQSGHAASVIMQAWKAGEKKGTAADIPKPLAVFGPKRSHQSVIM